MFGRAIWDKLPECLFEDFEIALVKWGQFQNFKKSQGWFIPKISRTKHVITGDTLLKLTSFNSGNYKSASGQLQDSRQWLTSLTMQFWLQSIVWLRE